MTVGREEVPRYVHQSAQEQFVMVTMGTYARVHDTLAARLSGVAE